MLGALEKEFSRNLAPTCFDQLSSENFEKESQTWNQKLVPDSGGFHAWRPLTNHVEGDGALSHCTLWDLNELNWLEGGRLTVLGLPNPMLQRVGWEKFLQQ